MKTRRSPLALALTAGLCIGAAATAQQPSSAPAHGAVGASRAASSKYKLSDAQLAEVQARAQLANTIVQNVSADASAKGAGEDWRIGLLSDLYGTPSSALRGISNSAVTLDQAHALALAARQQIIAGKAAAASAPSRSSGTDAVPDGIGSANGNLVFTVNDNLVFTPMTPCRFIDTRNVGGPIGPSPSTFNTDNFGSTYGGSSSCILPAAGLSTFAANVTIAQPSTAAGYLTVRPAGSSNVTSWMNWNQAGVTVAVANAGTISASLDPLIGYDFEMLTGGGTVQVIVDYFGYFSVVAPTALTCTYPSNSLPITGGSGQVLQVNSPSCPAGYTLTGGGCDVVNGGIYLEHSKPIGNAWSCFYTNTGSISSSVTASASCCQVP